MSLHYLLAALLARNPPKQESIALWYCQINLLNTEYIVFRLYFLGIVLRINGHPPGNNFSQRKLFQLTFVLRENTRDIQIDC